MNVVSLFSGIGGLDEGLRRAGWRHIALCESDEYRRVVLRERDVKLTAREFDLLSYLLAHPGRVHTRDTLLENVWGYEFSGDRKTVDVHIRWLREKFAGVAPFDIVTVRGIGYRLDRNPPAVGEG